MKHLILTLAALCALLLITLLGASFFLKSTVEDMTREAILSMTSPGEAVLEDVVFSPLSRELTITGWRARHQTNRGAVSTLAPTMRGQMTFRGVFACMPVLGDLVNDADAFVPVLANLKGDGFSWSSAEHKVKTGKVELGTISMRYGLLQQYSLGLRPPFAQGVAGIRVESIDVTDLELAVFTREAKFDVRADSMRARKVDGASATSVRLANLFWKEPGLTLSGREVTLEDVHISPALISELVAWSANRRHAGSGTSQLMEALAANGPVVGRTSIKNLVRQEGAPAFALENFELAWRDATPLNLEAHVRALKVSPDVLRALDLAFISAENLDELNLDADVVTSGSAESRITGLVRVKELGELSCDLLLHRETGAVSDAVLTFRDFGLTARVARTISPDPHASSMLLKAGTQVLCQNDPAQAREACRNIADFVDAPGAITVRGRAQPTTFMEMALGALDGRLGSLFSVETQKGSRSLTQQSDAIFGQGR